MMMLFVRNYGLNLYNRDIESVASYSPSSALPADVVIE